MTESQMLRCYIKAINKIDDYFEYSNESERDRSVVHHILGTLTAEISGTELPKTALEQMLEKRHE